MTMRTRPLLKLWIGTVALMACAVVGVVVRDVASVMALIQLIILTAWSCALWRATRSRRTAA